MDLDPTDRQPTDPAGVLATTARAAQLRESGDPAAAAAMYHAILAESPENISAWLGLGACARDRGVRAAAMAYFRGATVIDPDSPWGWLEVAAEFAHLGQPEAAMGAYQQVLGREPGNPHALGGLAALRRAAAGRLQAAGDFTGAAALYREVLAAAPGDIAALLGLGHCARGAGDRAAAMAWFRACTEADPQNPWAWLEIAAECRADGDAAAAAAAYRHVLAGEPDNPHARGGLAALLREAAAAAVAGGDAAAAEAAYQEILALAPGDLTALLGLGHAARRRGDRAAVRRYFTEATVAAPESPWGWLSLAEELSELGALDEAEAVLRRLPPGHAQAGLALGRMARRRGDRAAAMAHFEAVTQAEPDNFAAWLEIAAEQRDRGDAQAAVATAEAVLTRAPDFLPARLSLGHSHRHAGRHEAAFAAFEAAHLAAPEDADILVEMAQAARDLGRQAECDALLAQALALDPDNVAATMRVIEQALVSLNVDLADRLCRAARERQPGQMWFQLSAADVAAAQGNIEAALADLAGFEAGAGTIPRIRAKRIGLLRDAGDLHGALRLARESTAAAGHDFQLWVERFHCEILTGGEADVAACLEAIPAATARELAVVSICRGRAAENRWDLAAAEAHYAAAARDYPDSAWPRLDLVRVAMLRLDLPAARAHLREFCRLNAYVTTLQNKSSNISQTHFGQILDEYRVDWAVPRAAGMLRLAPEAAARALGGLALEAPDSTAVAVSLLVALRRAGAFARRPPASAAIPQVLVQFWDSAGVPADISRLMASWDEFNPGLTRHLFSDRMAQAYLAKRHAAAVLAAYRRAVEPAQKADIFRLAWLAAEGGIYADADDRCIAPLAGILPAGAAFVSYQEDHGTLGNNFIACVPGHPVVGAALRAAVMAINRGDTDVLWLSTGPALLTRCFAGFLAARAGEVPAGVVVLDRRELYQAVAIHCVTAYKKTDRHWNHSAFARRRGAAPPPGGAA